MVILNLIRIKDWLKNILIFFPLIFSGNLYDITIYPSLLIGFLTFSLVSSVIYIMNDILDISKDKLHPIKKYTKPLAGNKISNKTTYLILIILIILSLSLIYLQPHLQINIFLYLLLSLIYNLGLKKIPFLELFLLAFGYVIRIDTGSKIINVESSLLMLTSIFCLGIFFILIKRIGEMNQKNNNYSSRSVLKHYNVYNLKIYTIISILLFSLNLLIYILTININLIFSFILTIIFLIRYYFLTKDSSNGENPISFILSNNLLLLLMLTILISSLIIYI